MLAAVRVAVSLCHAVKTLHDSIREHVRPQGLSILCWCSDEIYANSIFKPDSQFTSLAVLASKREEHGLPMEDVHSYVHVMFGLSKDWCASGLRVGCLWTLNAPVQSAMQNLSYFCAVSGMAQHMLADMLEDMAFVERYLKENLRRLGAAYDTLAGLPCLLPLFLCVQTAHLLACSSLASLYKSLLSFESRCGHSADAKRLQFLHTLGQ